MNPNSQNQRWSKWVWFVVPGTIKARPFLVVRDNCARFGRKAFGSASQMRVRRNLRGYIIEVMTEGHPVHDPTYVDFMRKNWDRFFTEGFGNGTTTKMSAKLLAGSRQDGKPSDQLLILPQLSIQ
jgi:hypothetical protein